MSVEVQHAIGVCLAQAIAHMPFGGMVLSAPPVVTRTQDDRGLAPTATWTLDPEALATYLEKLAGALSHVAEVNEKQGARLSVLEGYMNAARVFMAEVTSPTEVTS